MAEEKALAMRKLNTIQQEDNLNSVYSVGDPGPGGAFHRYMIDTGAGAIEIQFQTGARNEEGSTPGVLGVDLLEIVRDTLISFQAGPFACDYNAKALEHVEAALNALNDRVIDRKKRNVLGKEQK